MTEPSKLDKELLRAAYCGEIKQCSILIATGADLDARYNYGETALILAAGRGDVEVVKVLIAAGAAVESRDKHGLNALMMAAGGEHRDYPETVKVLIAAGADLGSGSGDVGTPLHCAALNGRVEICQILIKAGADLGALDAKGRTPVEVATDGTVIDVIRAAISKVELKALEKSTGEIVKRKRIKKPAPVQSTGI